MDENIKQEKIELYLTGQLKDKELEEFESTINSDEALAQDVAIMKDLEEAMSDFEHEKELSNKLKFLSKKYITEEAINKTTSPQIVPIYRKKWFVAATVLLIVVAGGLLFQNVFQPKADTDLFATYYKSYPSNLLTRGENDETYNDIVKSYNENDFTTVINLLEERLADKPNDTPSKMMLGNSYLSLEPVEAQKAIKIFQPIANDNTNVYQETAQWYLALAYLENDNVELAEPILKLLSEKEYGKYPKLAQELLEKM